MAIEDAGESGAGGTVTKDTDIADDAAGMTDLARDAADGDLAAAKQLIQLVAPSVLRSVRLVLGPQSPDVDDIVQQSLIELVQALPGFRGECHPAGYASRIAVHTALSSRRRARARHAQLEDLAVIVLTQHHQPPSPPDETSATYRRQLVRELLDELPPEQADALALHVMIGYSLEEVARTTFTPLNTVKSRLRLAKRALKRRIESDPHLVEELDIAS